MNLRSVCKELFLINSVIVFLLSLGPCSGISYSRQPADIRHETRDINQNHHRILRDNAHAHVMHLPRGNGNGFGVLVPGNNDNIPNPNLMARREYFSNDLFQESSNSDRLKMRFPSNSNPLQRPHHGEIYVNRQPASLDRGGRSELNSMDNEFRYHHLPQTQTQDNNHNFGFDSIPSIAIHSSFQRTLPTHKEVSWKNPEVHLNSKKRNLVSTPTQFNTKNWWYPVSRVSSFQKTSHVPNEGFFQIELDDSDGDVTFETIMEVDEFEDEYEFEHGEAEY